MNWKELLQLLWINRSNVIILGDFNIDCLRRNAMVTRYTELLSSYGVKQLVSVPTRYTSEDQSTIIDHIITNLQENDVTCGVVATGISDHEMVFLSDKCVRYDEERCIRERDIVDYGTLENTLHSMDWLFVDTDDTMEGKFNKFMSKISSAIATARFTVTFSKRSTIRQPWVTGAILKSVKHKNNLYKKLRLTPYNPN